jgi:alpha-tubulin suppressor-like RCC1 family protein
MLSGWVSIKKSLLADVLDLPLNLTTIGIQPRENAGYEITDNTALIYCSSLSPKLYVKGLASNSFAHFCVITYANEVICWGLNDHGQLGLGHSE